MFMAYKKYRAARAALETFTDNVDMEIDSKLDGIDDVLEIPVEF
jgi:hypothetical protein